MGVHRMLIATLVVAGSLLAGAPAEARDEKRLKVESGLRMLQEAPKIDPKLLPEGGTEKILRRLAPAAPFAHGPEGQAGAQDRRAAFLKRLEGVWITKGRESGDNGVVECEEDKGKVKLEVPMRHTDSWIVDASQFFVVGAALAQANGSKPPRITLDVRSDATEGYGRSAISFAHATQDMAKCKNRADLWYCWNGELHASGGATIAKAQTPSLDGLKGIPAADWQRSAKPKSGEVYAVRCLKAGRKDFYVALRVAALAAEGCTIEWKLLATGYGAPASIQTEQPLVSDDGADGCDGMCGRAGGSGK
jgi:hypothetical protein